MAYLDWSLQLEEDGLGDEDLASLGAQVSYLRLEQLHLFAGATATHFEQAVDDGVEIDIVLVRHDRRRWGVEERWGGIGSVGKVVVTVPTSLLRLRAQSGGCQFMYSCARRCQRRVVRWCGVVVLRCGQGGLHRPRDHNNASSEAVAGWGDQKTSSASRLTAAAAVIKCWGWR